MRAARFWLPFVGLTVAVLIVGCGTTAPSPSATASLPYSLDFPEGWEVGTGTDPSAIIAQLEKSDSEWARRTKEVLESGADVENELVAYDFGSGDEVAPNVSCNTVDRGVTSDRTLLDLGERQNLEGIAHMPGTVAGPTADRVILPVGEAVRIRWQWEDEAGGSGGSSIGYLFPSGPFSVTCVFSAQTDTIASHEPEWEAILGTFQLSPEVAAQAAEGCPTGDLAHDAPEAEALLPQEVAGRRLAIWSVQGENALDLWGLSAEEIATLRDEVAALDADLDDVVQVTAGRCDTVNDPPYFVLAFRIPAAAADLLGGYAIAAAGFTRDTSEWEMEDQIIAGKEVGVGPTDLLVQTEHQRGRPYLYGSVALDMSFVIITDDEAWAEDAIRQLPE